MAPAKPLVVAAVLAAALGLAASRGGAAPGPSSRTGPTLQSCRQQVPAETHVANTLTVATNNPALEPWFVNDAPSNKQGFESALAYQIAYSFGFRAKAVTWFTEPFELATAAGAKPFDFDINEITYSRALTSSVAPSISYYNVNQSLVALKTNGIVKRHTRNELRKYLYGAVRGSPGLRLARSEILPARAPISYATLADAVNALQAKQIDAIVIDTPTGQYLTSQQLADAVQFAQFHTTGQYYVLVLQKKSRLLDCVDAAIKHLRQVGELTTLSRRFLAVYNAVPFITP